MKEKDRIYKLNQSVLTQGAKRRDMKNINGNDFRLASGMYRPGSGFVKRTSKLFREKIESDLSKAKEKK